MPQPADASPKPAVREGTKTKTVEQGGVEIPVAEEEGGRVWNHWDDEVAAKLQADAAAKQAADLGLEPPEDTRQVAAENAPTGPTGATGASGATSVTGATGTGEGTAAREARERAKIN